MQMGNYPCENGPWGIMVVIFIAPNSLMKTTFIMIVCTLRGNYPLIMTDEVIISFCLLYNTFFLLNLKVMLMK